MASVSGGEIAKRIAEKHDIELDSQDVADYIALGGCILGVALLMEGGAMMAGRKGPIRGSFGALSKAGKKISLFNTTRKEETFQKTKEPSNNNSKEPTNNESTHNNSLINEDSIPKNGKSTNPSKTKQEINARFDEVSANNAKSFAKGVDNGGISEKDFIAKEQNIANARKGIIGFISSFFTYM